MRVEDFQRDGKWRPFASIDNKSVKTVGGFYWYNMVSRCDPTGAHRRLKPSYEGCSHSFDDADDFISWGRAQVGYGVGALDKDLLVPGNREYCKERCVFVPEHVNNLLLKPRRTKEEPVGVRYVEDRGYRAQMTAGAKSYTLGYYRTSEEAFKVYAIAKEKELDRVAELYKDQLDARVYSALKTYKVRH